MRRALSTGFVILGSLLVVAGPGLCTAPAANGSGALFPLEIRAVARGAVVDSLGPGATVLHDYGASSLILIAQEPAADTATGIHIFETGETVGFRSWSGVVGHWEHPDTLPESVYVLRLIGPLDQRWRSSLKGFGVEVLAPAHPHALVVRADGASLALALEITTTEGHSVVQGIMPLPVEARLHRSLLSVLGNSGDVNELNLFDYGGRPLTLESKGIVNTGLVDLREALVRMPEIGYVEPVFDLQTHNNLAARTGLVGVESAWDPGYLGDGVVVSHNDSGVDLDHSDLAGAVISSSGRMKYTDSAHGTHTAGSIVGRGAVPAPVNSSGCGDQIAGLDRVSGMAPGSTMVTNNIFVEGIPEVAEMMAWGVRNGAHLSSNSWGLLGQSGPEVGYSAAAVQADAAVRDADPDVVGYQPLAIFFSAGNTGPDNGTVTSPGTAKNVITVGATQNARCGAWVPSWQEGPDLEVVLDSSGRGPSQGRIKPDVVAPGSDVLSLQSGDDYAVQHWDEAWTGPELALNTGTSQACAIAAGAGVVLHEALWRNRGRRPSPALLKASLIAGAVIESEGVDVHRGWGRHDLESTVSGFLGGSLTVLDQTETAELSTGEAWAAEITVRSASEPLRLAVVWTDVPGEEDADHPLVNDLDVVLVDPGGSVFRGNAFSGTWSTVDPGTVRDAENNVEVLRIQNPVVGVWSLEVVGVDVPVAPPGLEGQDFALAYFGDAGPCDSPPPAPSSLTATSDGSNRIRLSWTPVAGATRYEIARSLNPGGHPYEPVGAVASPATAFVDTAVSGGVDYFYVVRAERSCWSAYSAEVSMTGTGGCLLAPVFAGLATAESPGGTGCDISLGWTPAVGLCPDPVVYDIHRSTEEHFEPGPDTLVLEGVTGSTWLDQGLESDLDYHYLVRARHTGVAIDDGNLVVRGAMPNGPDDVYLWSDADEPLDGWIREPVGEADTGTEPWHTTDDDAWSGERSWFVADEDRVKDQGLVTAEPVDLPAGTAPVLEFRHRFWLHQGGDGGRLEYSANGGLDWQDILAGDGQTVPEDDGRWISGGYTATIGGIGNPLYGEEGWTGDSEGWIHSVVDLEAMAGRRILLRWRFACDESAGIGQGWWLDDIRLAVERECESCVSPDPPVGLQASAASNGVVLSWPASPGAIGYQISRAAGAGGPFQLLATVQAPQTEILDSTASGASGYTYVLAVDTGCLSEPSDAVTVTAGGPCTLSPLFWGLDGVEDRREPGCALDLLWRPATPGCNGAEVDYRIYRSSSPGFAPGPETLIADRVAGPRFRDTTVIDGELYHYRVRAVDEVSGREDANPVEQTGWTTGPQEVHFSDSVEEDLDLWWTAVGSSLDSGTESWRVDGIAYDGDRSWFCANEPVVKDQVVGLVDAFPIVDPSTILVFHHLFDLETFWDGGRLEYSTDGGTSWQDILSGDGGGVADNPDRFISGGYTGIASPGTGHPFGGQRVWTGFNGVWTETTVALGDFVGESVLLRWRLGCDRSDARVGWWIDRIELRTTTTCETGSLPSPRDALGRRH